MTHFFDSPDQLTDQDKTEIAALIHEGFRDMFAPAFKHVKETRRASLLKSMLSYNRGFYYKENNRILGTGVLVTEGTAYCRVPRSSLKLLGLIRYLVLQLVFRHRTRSGYLHLEMFAVSPDARGKGIGSRMMQALPGYAGKEGFHTLSLGVVDTNPRAKKLYEKLGYRVVKTKKAGWIARRAGYGAFDMMEFTP